MLNPKVEAAIEVGVEARSGVEVVPRLTVILCETTIIDMYIEYVCIFGKRHACIDNH